ncbi:Xaa-Pro peptidase family protein [Kribbella sp.]|uniref:M24 family metallopeptidase n=1 Tax=Kribbella sp. TaxID=1871183 RepID=UPI002D409504|nr:Xaa-Pro peptidase family protein [Kribbella sp.]HZX03082.1 Xaa-Pro peptidase family protein [Kribbella sp.]
MREYSTPVDYQRMESLLSDFEPSFDFEPAAQLTEAEYADRIERLRREATVAGLDALLVHASLVGWYHTSNPFLRYLCDWMREGVLILPTDADLDPELLSFWTESAVVPPGGEPLLVGDIWQISPFGRESVNRPGSPLRKTVDGCVGVLQRLGLAGGSLGLIGDDTAATFFAGLREELPRTAFTNATDMILRMQRIRSAAEIDIIRSAGELIGIGWEALCHVVRPGVTDYEAYAAFSYAQLARGGETGDGYQIGANRYGTLCGKPYGHVLTHGDLLNLYISNVTYLGYCAQAARMLVVGTATPRQDEVLEMTVDAVRRAEALIGPGVKFSELHDAAFEAYVERGYLKSKETRTMPFNWEAMPDGSPRRVKRQYVEDADWEAQGRRLMHVWPAAPGPHNPNLGHAIGMPKLPQYNVTSHNTDRMEPGMVFVLHAQWVDPLVAGSNLGDLYVVTEDGYENLTRRTPVEPYRTEISA